MKLVIYCADIGSVKGGNFGWASINPYGKDRNCRTGKDIIQIAQAVSVDLNNGLKVAFGFECPLFVPIPADPNKLTARRPGEENRAWSAVAGAVSLAVGLSESLWILNYVRSHLRNDMKSRIQVFLDWDEFQQAKCGLFIWEAFITKGAKSDSHHGDAEVAVKSFSEGLPNPAKYNAIKMGGVKVRSLIGAALIQSGWTKDLSFLSKPCIVIRANKQIGENLSQIPPRVSNLVLSNLSAFTPGCLLCDRKIEINSNRKCPICGQEFIKSWSGIDGHWRGKANHNTHEGIIKYEKYKESVCERHSEWK